MSALAPLPHTPGRWRGRPSAIRAHNILDLDARALDTDLPALRAGWGGHLGTKWHGSDPNSNLEEFWTGFWDDLS